MTKRTLVDVIAELTPKVESCKRLYDQQWFDSNGNKFSLAITYEDLDLLINGATKFSPNRDCVDRAIERLEQIDTEMRARGHASPAAIQEIRIVLDHLKG